ncbi:YcxB family protein [Actinophytocola gossypii]|uniref:YcxB family protein n=1 Tax=Actinophytocola gossypii TaxID=2812003 RepID=A0ABT2JGN4_9PSEU|nr:YcxB family protein [Actinophytocola gossypii]MCT2587045.1 YcxB family protein [Actinophytocola gossypii]
MTDELELRWDPHPADWGDAVRAVTPVYRWSPWFAGALAVFAVVLLVLDEPLPGLFGLGCAVLIAVLPPLTVNFSFRRNPVAATTVTATADDASLRMMTIDGTAYSDLRWSTLAGWLETRRGFVLRTGEATALLPVPLRAFGDEAEQARFRELLGRQLGPANRK